jgi:hypothetical protein
MTQSGKDESRLSRAGFRFFTKKLYYRFFADFFRLRVAFFAPFFATFFLFFLAAIVVLLARRFKATQALPRWSVERFPARSLPSARAGTEARSLIAREQHVEFAGYR